MVKIIEASEHVRALFALPMPASWVSLDDQDYAINFRTYWSLAKDAEPSAIAAYKFKGEDALLRHETFAVRGFEMHSVKVELLRLWALAYRKGEGLLVRRWPEIHAEPDAHGEPVFCGSFRCAPAVYDLLEPALSDRMGMHNTAPYKVLTGCYHG